MNKERVDYLHERFLKGTLTAAESREWKRAVDDQENEDQMLAFIEQTWKQMPDSALADMPELRAHEILNQVVAEPQLRTKVYRLWPKVAVAAAVVIAMALCIYFFTAPKGGRHLEGSVATRDLLNDIAPGKSSATITLANGAVIELSGAKKGVVIGQELTYADNSPVINANPSSRGNERSLDQAKPRGLSLPRDDDRFSKTQTLTAETKKGQTYEFTLPDGTHVWLNADSKISFPSQFDGKERRIVLSGEAYFAVIHNEKQPFRVVTNRPHLQGQIVEDIGTEFNISAYPDEASIKTTLVEGSALVRHLDERRDLLNSTDKRSLPMGRDDGNMVTLKPNQQANLIGNKLSIKEVNAEDFADWKAGKFIFNTESLESIMNKISRWYDVEISYQDQALKKETVFGSISRFENVSKVLAMLEGADVARFSLEGNKIIVKPYRKKD